MRNYKCICDDIENVENYEKAKADNFEGWERHHRLETHTSDGERRTVDISRKELQALGMYYHRPAEELIFISETNKGKHHSEETRKKCSEASKGRHWFNNGEINKFCYECPEGFVPGRLKI